MIPKSHPLHRLFRGLTESTFMTELGIGDPSLVGYVADLLASFVPSQMVWRFATSRAGRSFKSPGWWPRPNRPMTTEPQRVPSPRRRFHLVLDGRLSRGAGQAARVRVARLPDQLSAAGKAVLLPGQHPEHGGRSR